LDASHSSELNLRSWLGEPECVFMVAFGEVGVGISSGAWFLESKGSLFMGSLRWAAKGSLWVRPGEEVGEVGEVGEGVR